MTISLKRLFLLIGIAAFCQPLAAQTLKGPKACRAELRKHSADLKKAKQSRRAFLATCRKTPVGEETPIGDAAAAPPTAPAPMPPPAPAPPAPAADPPAAAAPPPAPPPPETKPAEPPKAQEAAPTPPPEAEKPEPAKPAPAAQPAPPEDHSLPGWWNWTMRLAAAAVLLVAGIFAARGLMRIRKAEG